MTTKTFTFAPTDAITADIRTVELEGAWWFVAADVCRALDLKPDRKNGSFQNHYRRLPESHRQKFVGATLGFQGLGAVMFISEAGLYR